MSIVSRLGVPTIHSIARVGLWACICLVLLILAAITAFAEDMLPAQDPVPATRSPEGQPLTEQDINTFLDGFMSSSLQTMDIAGATVSVVANGKLLTARGYGYADVAHRIPMDGHQTLVRPGSISKLFTWTAVMQLVETGKLDLDRDVNEYLDFRIPAKYGKPITLRHIMTHTAGFEERGRDLLTFDPVELLQLRQDVSERIPPRIFPPGEVPAYSNYATALAGYIVERQSGVPYAKYIDKHVLAPLSMTHSTADQPLPANLRPNMALGYDLASKDPIAFELVQDAPAGSMSATAADMGKFMIAYLNGGILVPGDESTRILGPATVTEMMQPANRPADGVNYMGLGFYEETRNGTHIMGHAGDTFAFHSELHLLLDRGIGIFISMNSGGKDGAAQALRAALFREFLNRYLPVTAPLQQFGRVGDAELARTQDIAGMYQISRRSESTFLDVLNLITQNRFSVDESGNLSAEAVYTDIAHNPLKFRETQPDHYRAVNDQVRLAVARDKDGEIKFITSDIFGSTHVMQPVPSYKSKAWIIPGLVVAFGVIVIGLIGWPMNAWRRRWSASEQPLTVGLGERRRLWLARAGGVCALLFTAAMVVIVAGLSGDDAVGALSSSRVPAYRLVQLFALVTVIAAFALVAFAVRNWARAPRPILGNIGRSIYAAAMLMFAYVIITFNVLSVSMNF